MGKLQNTVSVIKVVQMVKGNPWSNLPLISGAMAIGLAAYLFVAGLSGGIPAYI
jgi:hypothetical protein